MERAVGHQPVLPREVVDLLEPAGRELLVDCTVGTGGHAEALIEAAGPGARLIAVDLDPSSLRIASKRLERFGTRVRCFQANFADLPEVLAEAGEEAADAVLADLGVSSTQLDDASRGMSFRENGPLDMRMDVSDGRTAAELVNALGEKDLAGIIYRYGEERYSRRIAAAIVRARKGRRIELTKELAGIVAGAIPAPARRTRRGVHPATRTFLALRIAVNDELANLEKLLAVLPGVLAVGGRAAVISFHSLEDRLVKRAFRQWAGTGNARVLTKKPIRPSAEEVAGNPRSRSAKLRGIEYLRRKEG